MSQNLVIGDCLSFRLYFSSLYLLTGLWLKHEHGSEPSAAKSSELVSNPEPATAQNNILDTFSADFESQSTRGENITEAGRGCWCLFVNLAGTEPTLLSGYW